ncbi:MAG TPA: aldo/keto reductase [Terriglobales bacterium]|nr:aldo/keto reductase [Terriglobales bacterium]
MQYRKMGKTGVEVSSLGFGCMRLPVHGGVTENIDEEQTAALFREAYDLGVNYWDTAYPYHGGKSEEAVGRTLKKLGIRNRIFLATKLPAWLVKGKDDLPRLLDEQLMRLQTDHIDFYLMHNPDHDRWPALWNAGMTEFIDTAKAQGKIRFAGFSMHDNIHHFTKVLDSYPWDFTQLQYNYLDVRHQAGQEGVDLVRERGIGLVIMEPLKGGQLATRLPHDLVEKLYEAHPDRTPADWALRFVLNEGAVSTALSGMNAMSQLQENIAVAERAGAGSLTAQELALLGEIRESYHARQKVGCTSCMYCMPCPQGVDIYGNFSRYNAYFMAKSEDAKSKLKAAFLAENDEDGPAKCIACGACLSKCPQGIDIPTQLKNCEAAFTQK